MKDKIISTYRITNELLGSGSYSEVYLGYNSSEEKVAVKIIPRQKINDKQINMFQTQIKLLNSCKNQNIINLIDFKKTKTNFYIFLEYCQDGNLAQYIAQNQQIDENQSVRIFIQIVKGMNAMRKSNIIHRDLKPANIMMKGKNIKIGDFGLAKKYSNGQFFNSFAGTPLNMAPQILKGKPYNEKADVYSAGTILYQMLFGIKPCIKNDSPFLMDKIEVKCLSQQKGVKIISDDLNNILKKMIQPNPEKRIDFPQLMVLLQQYENKQIQKKLINLKKSCSNVIYYISITGGICSLFNLNFIRVKQKSIYDMDLKICGKISQRLITNQLQWLSNIDLIRV